MLYNAILRAAGGLLLAGSLGLVCASVFAQAPTKPPATGASSGAATTKKTVSSASGSAATHGSTSNSTAAHATTGHASKTSAKKRTGSAKSSRVKTQTAPTPDRIRDIQSALGKAGAYDGDPTGNWDAHTVSSLTKFQQSNGLAPSGKLDALTLQKLGLGSGTAGKGAPRPAATPTVTTVSPSTGNHR